jgi:trimeric autotransporter adhesin
VSGVFPNLGVMKKEARSILMLLTFICLAAAAPDATAVSPPPDGCYPNYTTAEGCNALNFLTSGAGNTGVGWYALYVNTTGNFNTGVGGGALALNNADSNTAVGAGAMLLNTTGGGNTAVGTDALLYNDSGILNTAVGEYALFSNTTGDQNTALGEAALSGNVDGDHNTATGQFALFNNDHGDENTANGFQALAHNTGGAFNTAVGESALYSNTAGQSNTAVGIGAGFNQDTGSGNVYIGSGAIGVAGEDNHTYIRNINITNVNGGNADFVTVDLTTGLLGHASSSRRYKEDIQPMDKASEALYRLNPVTYRYKKEIDPTQSPAFGLIAEEVAKANPELVARNAKGQPESVHYEMINAMLLNEFLKEHRKVEEQQATIADLKNQLQTVNARLEQQAAQIQKVSAQREMSKAVPQMVVNNP